MTPRVWRAREFSDLIFKQQFSQSSAARIFAVLGPAVLFFAPLEQTEGIEHRVAHQSSVFPRSLLENAGASRRSVAASSSAGPRLNFDR
jgi:hypothetical protein